MSNRLKMAGFIFIGMATWTLAQPAEGNRGPVVALKGLDPVELASGREVAGAPAISTDKGKFRYYFSGEGNRLLFEEDPGRYSIQFGGACARMGPLSGAGDPDRYSVYLGRIYIFASEACRKRFNTEPSRFVDVQDEAPRGTQAAAEQAADLLNKAVDAVGGGDALRNLRALQVLQEFTQTRGEKQTVYSRSITAQFPGSYAEIEDYGSWRGGWVLRGESGFLTWEKGVPVEPPVRDYMERTVYRHPVTILKAWLNGDVKAVCLEREPVDESPLERVSVFIKGASSLLWINSETGQIARISYRGRAPEGISDIVEEFSDFRDVGGLALPFAIRRQVDGRTVVNPSLEVKAVLINDEVELSDLERPK